jgi:hypothetical protein
VCARVSSEGRAGATRGGRGAHTWGDAAAQAPHPSLPPHIPRPCRNAQQRCPSPLHAQICSVTSSSPTCTSLVEKSAPIVALYCEENLAATKRSIRDVFPTPCAPRMIIFCRLLCCC